MENNSTDDCKQNAGVISYVNLHLKDDPLKSRNKKRKIGDITIRRK